MTETERKLQMQVNLLTAERDAQCKAADHWMTEANKAHNNSVRLKAERDALTHPAPPTQQVAVPAWTIAEERMPKPCVNVLAYTGKAQPIRAQWVPAKTLEDNCNSDFGEYDESTDLYYWPEAWYETNEHEETHWMVDDPVTHWMPLPPSPQGDT